MSEVLIAVVFGVLASRTDAETLGLLALAAVGAVVGAGVLAAGMLTWFWLFPGKPKPRTSYPGPR